MIWRVFTADADEHRTVTVEAVSAGAAVARAVANLDDFVIGPTWAVEDLVATTEEKIRAQLAIPVDMGDTPIDVPKLLARIAATATEAEARWLNAWIDKQQTCTVIMRHHGYAALEKIVRAIAEASVRTRASMCSRVRSIAEFYEI